MTTWLNCWHDSHAFALVQLCYLRYPGYAIPPHAVPPIQLLAIISQQLRLEADYWPQYSEREETRREHLSEIRAYLGLIPFGLKHFRQAVHFTTDLALQTDKGLALATQLLHHLRTESVVLPPLAVIERICAEAVTWSNRRIYQMLTASITDTHRRSLNSLLCLRENTKISTLVWLRQPPGMPNAKHLLEHMEWLRSTN